jgi:hypothetical protein
MHIVGLALDIISIFCDYRRSLEIRIFSATDDV